MEAYSLIHNHKRITLLVQVLRMRILVAANMWHDVASTLQRVETALGLSYTPSITPKPRAQDSDAPERPQESFIYFEDKFEVSMAVHALMMSVVYFTHVGHHSEASPRLSHLHALLDAGALDKFAEGIVEVCEYVR